MIISPVRRFCFIHLPKTGGTSLTAAYEEIARVDDLLFGDTPRAKIRQAGFNRGKPAAMRLSKHATLADATHALPRLKLRDFMVVAIVRNPWDRLVSFYHWARVQTFDHPQVRAARRLGFPDFVRAPETAAAFSTPSNAYWMLETGPPSDLRLLRFEILANEVATLPLATPLPLLPHLNMSDRPRDWRTLYDDETAALVPALFPFETQELGYRFDP
ncbi:MAG: sulfotransferase family 2 domain-containing protein [Rubricella sp.]